MMRRLEKLPAVLARTALSRSNLYAKVSRGEFPAPIPLGARAVAWDSEAVSSWIEGRIAVQRDKKKAKTGKPTPKDYSCLVVTQTGYE